MVFAGGQGQCGECLTDTEFQLEDEKVLETDYGDGCTAMWIYSMPTVVHLKMVKTVHLCYVYFTT